MSEHHSSIVVKAPVPQVYALFTHFNDFPKFMRFVKEVTYYDDERSHWVANLAGTHEWDAINEDWIPDQQIGWRSTNGLENRGRVKFTQVSDNRTQVDAYISYTPPAGIVGQTIDNLGIDTRFDTILQQDLEHFAHMVEEAPANALDPMQSHYLFHPESAMSKGEVTSRQQEAMTHDPMMAEQALQEREQRIQGEVATTQQAKQIEQEQQQHIIAEQQRAFEQQQALLSQQAEQDRQSTKQTPNEPVTTKTELDPVQDTLGGRNASMERTAFGDQDGRTERFPNSYQDPMLSRAPKKQNHQGEHVEDMEIESPWRTNMSGQSLDAGVSEQDTSQPAISIEDDSQETASKPQPYAEQRKNSDSEAAS